MAKKAPGGAYIHHTTGIRMRVTGTGNLQMTLYSLDAVDSVVLVPFVMTPTNAREPLRLANFKSQRTQLDIRTTVIDETFRIDKIIFFVKAVETDFPS